MQEKKLYEITDETIEEIVNEINYSRIQDVMDALDWKWLGSKEIPSKTEIRNTAIRLIKNLKEKNIVSSSSGGFEAYRNEFCAGVRFVVDDSFYPDAEYEIG